jgi:hypothetical protein
MLFPLTVLMDVCTVEGKKFATRGNESNVMRAILRIAILCLLKYIALIIQVI